MSYLLRVELPDVPGSLGALASAIGTTGANIDAIEIVERNPDGHAIDDVFIAADHGVMPDTIVSACTQLDGVEVHWISRYAAGGNLFLDLEAVEAMTDHPSRAIELLLGALPEVFRVDWALHLRREGAGASIVSGTTAAPTVAARWNHLAGQSGEGPADRRTGEVVGSVRGRFSTQPR